MVSVQEAEQQVKATRKKIESQRAVYSATAQQIEQQQVQAQITKQDLLKRTLQQREQSKLAELQRLGAKTTARQQLESERQTFETQARGVEKQLSPIESQIAEAKEWERATQLSRSGKKLFGMSKSLKDKVREIKEGRISASQIGDIQSYRQQLEGISLPSYTSIPKTSADFIREVGLTPSYTAPAQLISGKEVKYVLPETTKFQPTFFSNIITGVSELQRKKTDLSVLTGAVKTAYVMSPFGVSTPLPKEYHKLRETGYGKYGNILTWSEAKAGLQAQKEKETKAIKQDRLIAQMQKEIEEAPESQKYNVYQKWLKKLKLEGVLTLPSIKEQDKIGFYSSSFIPSKTFEQYQWGRETEPVGKAILGVRKFSTEAVKTYALTKGAGWLLGGVSKIPVIGKIASKFPTTTKVLGYGAGVGVVGSYGYGKYQQYQLTPQAEKPLFWSGTAGELTGVAVALEIPQGVYDWITKQPTWSKKGMAGSGKKKPKTKQQLIQQKKKVVAEKTAEAEPYIKDLEELWKQEGVTGLRRKFNTYMEIYKRQTTAVGKNTALKNIKLLLQKSKERNLITGYILDENTGRLIISGKELATPTTIQQTGGVFKSQPQAVMTRAKEPVLVSKVKTIQKQKVGSAIKPMQISFTESTQRLKQEQRLKQNILSMSATALLSLSTTAQKTRQQQQQVQQTKQTPVLLSLQQTLTAQRTGQRLRQKARETTTTTPKVPFLPTKLYAGSGLGVSRLKDVLGKVRRTKAYTLQSRTKGKWFDIEGGLPFGLGLKKGSEVAERTLRASFRLKPSGFTRKKDIDFTLSSRFRLPKARELPLTYVQKRKFRLSARSEVSEIIKSKRRLKIWG